jgi:hypothetical protein
MEHRDQGVEVTVPRGGAKGVDDLPLALQVSLRWGGAADPPPGAAGQHLRRVRGSVDHWPHLGERHPEQVVQDEREPLRRRERVLARP